MTSTETNRRATVRRRDEAAAREVAFCRAGKDRSVVYFIERDGLIKIGTTRHLQRRMRAHRGVLLATEPGAGNREAQLHELFADLRTDGEWFRPAPELRAYISTLPGEDS